MSKSPPSFKVGDTLYYVPRDNRYWRNEPVTITKVGRKWCVLSNNRRFDRTDDKYWMYVDGGEYSSPGTLYRSSEDYEEYRERKLLLEDLTRHLAYGSTPMLASLQDIRKAAVLLGMNIVEGSHVV
jgi:hypothetical protein